MANAPTNELIGTVRGPGRTPTANAAVTVRWRSHPELPGLCGYTLDIDGVSTRTVATDARGRFRVALPVAGPFELLASSADKTLVSIRRFPVMTGGFIECELVTAPWIGGIVRDADDAPMVGFELALEPFEQTWMRHRGCGSPVTRYRVTTDELGHWRCTFPSGYLQEPFWDPYLVPTSADPLRQIERARLLMPDVSCQKLKLGVTKMPVVVGFVLDVAGKPIVGARVFDPHMPAFGVRTNDAGRFRMPTAKPKRLHAAARGWLLGMSPKQERVDGRDELHFQLIAAPASSVVLRDKLGGAVAGRPVLWCDRWNPQWPPLEHATRTDENGAVALGGEGLGNKSIGFVSIGGLYVPFVSSADATLQEIAVAARTLDGTILNANGIPIASARITARSREQAFIEHGDPLWVTYSDHGGRFRFASLPAGRLVLTAAAGVAGFAKAEIAAVADQADLQTGKEEAFEVEVLDDDEKPCAGVWVTLTSFSGVEQDFVAASPSGGATLVGFTDANGKALFRGVPDAQWFVLGMRLNQGKIEATQMVALQRGAVTRIGLAEHKR